MLYCITFITRLIVHVYMQRTMICTGIKYKITSDNNILPIIYVGAQHGL